MNIDKINVGGNLYDVCDTNARAMISDEYNSATQYSAGDYCIWENTLKKANKSTTGTYDHTAWDDTNIGEVVGELNQNMLRISVFNMTLKYSSANVLMASVNHSLGVTPKACIAQISSSDGSLRAFGYALSAEATSSRIIGYAYSASNWNSGDTVDVKVTAFYYKP